jgi:hypothetical protein
LHVVRGAERELDQRDQWSVRVGQR